MSQELHELPEGWEWQILGSVGKVTTGNTPPKAKKEYYGNESGYLFVKPPQLDCSEPIIETPEKLTEAGFDKAKPVEKGSILVCCIGSIGKIGIAGTKLATNQQINSITFDNRVDFKWGYYFALTLESTMKAMANSAVVSIINKSTFSKIEIPIPPLNEQKRIVARLDALFTRINTAIAHLQQTLELSKALFASETNIAFDQISSKYGTRNLSKLVQINSGIALPKIFKDWKASGSISFYKVAQMNNDNRIMKDAAITFDSEVALAHRIKLFPKGSVLIPKRGGAILTDKKRLLLEDASYDSNIMGLKADEKNITDEYLFRFLLSINLGNYIDTAVIPQINNKHIDQMQIPLAPIEEQNRIVAHLDALSERTRTLEAATKEKLNDLTTLKASLLDATFKGQL